jgi:hypothetical protein
LAKLKNRYKSNLKPMNPIKLVPALLALTLALKGQFNSYDYCREIKPVNESGYYQIKLGSSVLDRDGYYRVYEVNDKDSIEVPHVVNSNKWDIYTDRSFTNLRIIDKSYESGKFSYATLVLDTNIIYNSVYLNFDPGNFFKDVTLEGSNDNKSWKTIVENEKVFSYYHDAYDNYFRNKIVFEPVSFKYLRIKTDDSDSPKLNIVSASVPLVKEEYAEENEYISGTSSRTENKKEKVSYVECVFPRAYCITGLDIVIENAAKYRRNVRIESYNPVNGKEKWIVMAIGFVASGSSNRLFLNNYSHEDFQFKTSRIRLAIENLDNRPLEKIELKPFTRTELIKLKLEKDKKYVLAYGKKEDQLPQYDLEYFKNSIPLNLKTVELGNEIKIPHSIPEIQKPLVNSKLWIWVALVGCVLIIGVFSLKLLKPEPKAGE